MLEVLRWRPRGESAHRAPTGLWGDPFALDDLSTMAGTRSWSFCSSDEFLCVFPALIGITPVPDPLLNHMRLAVGRLTTKQDFEGRQPDRTPPKANSVSPFGTLKRWLPTQRAASEPEAAREMIDGIDRQAVSRRLAGIVIELEQRRCPNFSMEAAAEVAFWTGVHPAYIWEEALLSHELFSAIGWVGICQQGRDALLPAHIAEYFVDTIRPGDRCCRVLEPLLASYLPSDDFAARILKAAEERLSRRRDVVVARHAMPLSLAGAMQ